MSRSKSPHRSELVRVDVAHDVEERLDAFLAGELSLSRSRAAALISEGRVRIDGSAMRKSYRPRAGDSIEVDIPPPDKITLAPESIPVSIVYEDDHLLVVDKPSGLVVHPAPGHPSGTLVNALLAATDQLSTIGAPLRPGIVHRLDRDTSGLMVVAKREAAHRALAAQIAARKVGRGYLALSWGHLDFDDFTIDRPVGRDPRNRKRMAVVASGKRAVTHVRVLERLRAADLLAVRLRTGRTHQIRVHLEDLGHPIVRDAVYAGNWHRGMAGAGGRWAAELRRRTDRMFLHAARLSFHHPVGKKRMTFTSPLPESLAGALAWARDSSHR